MYSGQNTKLLDNIQRLLKPQQTLSPHIFFSNGHMRDDVRAQILNRLEIFAGQTFKNISGTKLEDAFLCGSSASYLWKDNSDFDIWLKVGTENFLVRKAKSAQVFFNRYAKAVQRKNFRRFSVNGHMLDIKIGLSNLRKMYGVYSIFQNRWIITPRQDLTTALDAGLLYDTVLKRYAEIEQVMENYRKKASLKVSFRDVKKMTDYYDKVLDKQYSNVFEYIVLKLLRYEGITIKLRDFCADELARYFSINNPFSTN